MKRNWRLIPCYYRDWKSLIEYKKITYRDHLDYSERLFYKWYTCYYFRWCYIIFKNKHVAVC